ncbi:MAG: sensor histidine kinase [Piscinibacter sp.]|uniref:sensor histidine kinase n=1 Tax=Piscinibacter sp. TaxID=1903157 RepID=UPI003D0EFD73
MDPIASTTAPRPRRSFVWRGAKVMLVGTGIALLYSLPAPHRIATSMAYALPITFGCWFFIDGGRLLAARWVHRDDDRADPQWPGWPWMAAIIVIGTLLGFTLGQMLGNLITGQDVPSLLFGGPQRGLTLLLMSMVPGVVATWVFYTRGRLADIEARAQQAQRQAAEAQLKLLESQLEPHMLFNTLANLRVLIAIDPPRAQAMLDRLIAFLRATLDASRTGRHALSAEFARLADYLALMQVRMGERLRTQFDLPDDLTGVAVPPLLLQPLVENAIRHGLEPAVAGGRIEIGASRHGDTLELRVRDTGVGLDRPAGDGTRFGLQQVRDRLATLYGERASLVLQPAGDAEGGALAIVRLPITP